jgi:uncharacterized membrane protein YccC
VGETSEVLDVKIIWALGCAAHTKLLAGFLLLASEPGDDLLFLPMTFGFFSVWISMDRPRLKLMGRTLLYYFGIMSSVSRNLRLQISRPYTAKNKL